MIRGCLGAEAAQVKYAFAAFFADFHVFVDAFFDFLGRPLLEDVVIHAQDQGQVLVHGVGLGLFGTHLEQVGVLDLQVGWGRPQLQLPEGFKIAGEGIPPPVVANHRLVTESLQTFDVVEGKFLQHVLGDEGQRGNSVGAIGQGRIGEFPQQRVHVRRNDLIGQEGQHPVDEFGVVLDLQHQLLERHALGGKGEGGAIARRRRAAGQFLVPAKRLEDHRHASVGMGVRRLQPRQVLLRADDRFGIVDGRRHVVEQDQVGAQRFGFHIVDVPHQERRVEAEIAARFQGAPHQLAGIGVELVARDAALLHGEFMHLRGEGQAVGAGGHGRVQAREAGGKIKFGHA